MGLADKRELGWFLIAILLLRPIGFIRIRCASASNCDVAGWREPAMGGDAGCHYVVLVASAEPSYSWLFPKVWILLAALCLCGRTILEQFTAAFALAATAVDRGVIAQSTRCATKTVTIRSRSQVRSGRIAGAFIYASNRRFHRLGLYSNRWVRRDMSSTHHGF